MCKCFFLRRRIQKVHSWDFYTILFFILVFQIQEAHREGGSSIWGEAVKPRRRRPSHSWSPRQAAWHLVHMQGKEATSSHGALFLHLNCWCLTCTTCLTHRKGKGTNIYQVPAPRSEPPHMSSHSVSEWDLKAAIWTGACLAPQVMVLAKGEQKW